MRTATSSGSSRLVLKRWLPHSPQKAFPQPSGGCHERTNSSPRVIPNEPGAVSALTENAVPVRRWQRVQWQ